jgi:hypothetical protein
MLTWTQAVTSHLQDRYYFHFGVVFAKIVVESLQGHYQHERGILHIKFANCLLRLAVFASKIVIFAQILRGKECIDDAPTLFKLRIHQSFFIDFSLRNVAFGEWYFFIEDLGERNSNFKTKIKTPANFVAIKAF